jgi:hypothetical protein
MMKFKKATRLRQLLFSLFICLLVLPNFAHSQSFSHLDRFRQWIGQKEQKPNRSPLIDSMNRYVGSPLGSPYCAAAVSYSIRPNGPKSGLARSLRTRTTFTALDVIQGKKQIKRGYILIWQKGETISGHAGLANKDWNKTSGETVEGNTSAGNKGSQSNGDGFFIRQRSIQPTSYFRIKWITPI